MEVLPTVCRKFWTIVFCMVMLNFRPEFYTVNMEQYLFQPCLLLYSVNYNHSIPRLWSLSMLTSLLSSTYHQQGIYVRDPWVQQEEWCHLCIFHMAWLKTDTGRAFYHDIIQKQKKTSVGKGLLVLWSDSLKSTSKWYWRRRVGLLSDDCLIYVQGPWREWSSFPGCQCWGGKQWDWWYMVMYRRKVACCHSTSGGP